MSDAYSSLSIKQSVQNGPPAAATYDRSLLLNGTFSPIFTSKSQFSYLLT